MSLKERTSSPGSVSFLKGVFFGIPKSGKTTTACSGTNTLLIEFEPEGDATASLKGRKDVDVIKPADPKDVEGIIKDLHTSDRDTWDFVVVDSTTYMYDLYAGAGVAAAVLKDTDPRRAYQKGGVAVNQALNDLLAVPAHVLLVAQQRSFTPGEDGVPLNPDENQYPISLDVTPMVYRKITPAVSFIGRCYKRQEYEKAADGKRNKVTKFYVSFDDGHRSPAGSRLELPPTVENLNLNKLVKFVEGGS